MPLHRDQQIKPKHQMGNRTCCFNLCRLHVICVLSRIDKGIGLPVDIHGFHRLPDGIQISRGINIKGEREGLHIHLKKGSRCADIRKDAIIGDIGENRLPYNIPSRYNESFPGMVSTCYLN